MSYKEIPFGTPEKFNALIEIQKGSLIKYEFDEASETFRVSTIFRNHFAFSFDYGSILQTRGGDTDMLDVFVLGSQSIQMGVVVECRPIGIIRLIDRGEEDDKILAIPVNDPASKDILTLEDLAFDYKKVFEDFFKELAIQRNKTMEIKGYENAEAAKKALEVAHKNFTSYHGTGN